LIVAARKASVYRASCRASVELHVEPPYARLCAEPPYAGLRAKLRAKLRA